MSNLLKDKLRAGIILWAEVIRAASSPKAKALLHMLDNLVWKSHRVDVVCYSFNLFVNAT